MANLALGGKLIWQLYKEKNHPVNKNFRMKYLKGRSLRNITLANTSSSSGIWNFWRKCFESFNHQLYRTPGNGKKIYLREDNIFGKPPLSNANKLTEIQNWAINKGLLCLADICSWDRDGNWVGWSLPDLPAIFNSQKTLLFTTLSGLALVHLSQQDCWGWGLDGFYSIAKGYKALNTFHSSCLPPTIWKLIWYSRCLPKVNLFS